MGCGASRVVQAIEEDPEKSPAPPDQQQQQHQPDELTSVRSNTPDQPDQASRPVDPPSSGPVIQSNGTEHSAPTLEDNLPKSPVERKAPHSGGTRAVAFEVGPPDASESLIRRHPPRKFQRLEDQQQGNTITQEKLEEKQATAERRRQEILTQRVQSAKHRSATRMRPHPDDADEVEKDDGVIETAASITSENEL
ncbi:uncharacterized protein LOC123520014 isoform X2 [Portunus trituberculatus]|uniref:uncharacterized protein LOC123520014 isoform X2 n=1 Tax=Portunus trituberculatus TaxID=210409 RepID=UPI001E1CEE48|nr:uncharacterized protein LOC123520014 isoform X2 [Portunus trituberculatus]